MFDIDHQFTIITVLAVLQTGVRTTKAVQGQGQTCLLLSSFIVAWEVSFCFIEGEEKICISNCSDQMINVKVLIKCRQAFDLL